MKVMILAAGRGERMRPLTDTCPKPLLRVNGVPLIAYHLRRLQKVGLTDIIINHAWLGQQIEQVLGDGQDYGVQITYSAEGEKGLETAGGIATALPFFDNKPFLVINGDVLTDVDLVEAKKQAEIMRMSTEDKLAYLWMVNNPPHNLDGDFYLASNGQLHTFGEQDSKLTFSGVGIYHPQLFAQTPRHKVAKLAPLLRIAMEKNKVYGAFHQGLWLDVGTVSRLKEAERLAKSHIL